MTLYKATQALAGRTALITSADAYMGPAIAERFASEQMELVLDNGDYLTDPDEPGRIVAAVDELDVLVVNLIPRDLRSQSADAVTEKEWNRVFNALVHPTMRFVTAALPRMIERRCGKIIVVTSTAPLRPRHNRAAYSTARGAQNAYVEAVGREVARYNVQVNAIAQSYVYGGFPRDYLDDPDNREAVLRDVPARRLAEGAEQAALVRFLASNESDFIVGQTIAFSGGWVTR
ncbi:SDR family NAD(P)-dependent oxidoreductase [Novosphingopyxis sp.]|uniref:SDR family NAD(P)-dependent oxidoreductase n=1 Tax=Novosphingopyxis sp. TaxID=2709690 RepID=UPI003B59BE21